MREWLRENWLFVAVPLLVGVLVYWGTSGSSGDIERWEDEEAGVVCWQTSTGLDCLPYGETTLRYSRK